MAPWDRDRDRDFDPHRHASWQTPTTVRMAAGDDLVKLDRLAQLDSRQLPPAPHLVAERDGRIEAALSLSTEELVADPFRRTAELRELLRCQAGNVGAARRRSPSLRLQPSPLPVTT
jgi:hypothetical protein